MASPRKEVETNHLLSTSIPRSYAVLRLLGSTGRYSLVPKRQNEIRVRES